MADRTWGDPSNPRQVPVDADLVAAEAANGASNYVWTFAQLRTYLDTYYSNGIPNSIFTAPGELLAGTGAGTYQAQPAGSDGFLLSYDSGQATGVAAIDPGTVGVTDHPSLTGRDTVGSHPTAAITGLDTALASKMDVSVYDPNIDGVVDGAESLRLAVTNDVIGTLVPIGEVIRFNASLQLTTRANASTQVWGYAITAETIGNGATGQVITKGLATANTTGMAISDALWTGDNGAISNVPIGDPSQSIGLVLSVGVLGTIWFEAEAAAPHEADGAIGILTLLDTAGTFSHVQTSGGTWVEFVPGLLQTAVLEAENTRRELANAGRLEIDYSGSNNPPAAGTITGEVSLQLSLQVPNANAQLDITLGVNGAIVSADVKSHIGIGGALFTGAIIPVSLVVPITGLSDLDDLSVFGRGTADTWFVHSFSVAFSTQGVGTTGTLGSGTDDHRLLNFRGSPGQHPADAISFTPAGSVQASEVQAAIVELDAEKASKTSGVPNGNLGELFNDNLADSGVATTTVTGHIADGTIHFSEGTIDHAAIQNIGSNTHAQIDTALSTLPATFVSSFEARTGAVVAQPGDYTAADVGAAPDTHVGAGGAPATHALAVAGGAAGFLSGADKTKIDNVPSQFVATFEGRDGTVTAQPGDYTAAEVGAIPAVGTTDGDLFSFDGTSYTRIGVGADGRALIARPGNSVGLKLVWEDVSSSGGGIGAGAPYVVGDLLALESDSPGDGTAETVGFAPAVVARTDMANTFLGDITLQGTNISMIMDANGQSALEWHLISVPKWIASTSVILGDPWILGPTNGAGAYTAQSIRIETSNQVAMGTPVSDPTELAGGSLTTQGEIVGEGGVLELIGGTRQQVLNPKRSAEIGVNIGYGVVWVPHTAGSPLTPDPLTGNHVRIDGTAATDILAVASAGDVTVSVENGTSIALNAVYAGGTAGTEPTGRDYLVQVSFDGVRYLAAYV